MRMTYRRLKEQLEQITPEQLDCDVSIKVGDGEFVELDGHIQFTNEDDPDDDSVGILDEGHPWLCLLY